MRIKFLWVGKTKNASVQSLISDYLGRVRHFVPCEVIETRDLSKRRSLPSAELIECEGKELARHVLESGRLVALDEKGIQFSSQAFADWLESEQNKGIRTIAFVIGGPEGLSDMISKRAHLILSMGKMTWPHEMCRVLLLEQVYRALCILRNIPYHRSGS
ncbi:MAG: 23S rRNA (pseudouridine(1915)-N(3))-methyltransferase RlmH [Acidobacteriota bacterium]|jgi:23S rRNA (pseudouridine1915-N3)-methyltransferase